MNKSSKILLFIWISCNVLIQNSVAQKNAAPIPAAQMTQEYLPFIQNKKIALLVNQTSTIGDKHLVDSLLNLNIQITKIFCPEHGFRGNADAGEKVDNSIDSITKLPIISLYGNNKKPKADDLKDIEYMIFDVQDVGVRFYTYISTLHYVMEACAENNIPLIVLDRPNPNGHYIDGPVLKSSFNSFVGMHPVPVVYGMSIGEYALMINGEGWLKDQIKCDLKVIQNQAYSHDSYYTLKIKPSPNLPDMESIALYPSLCFFEGTVISMGRGTYSPFKYIGHPILENKYTFQFIPESIPGMSKEPPYKNQTCYGLDLSQYIAENGRLNQIELKWLIEMYQAYPEKEKFFNNFFNKLAGNADLQKQIKEEWPEALIRKTWRRDIQKFKKIRSKYLLYK